MALKGQKTKSDFLEWDILQSLILKLERDYENRLALLIAVGAYVGLRATDLLNLKWKNLIYEGNGIQVRNNVWITETKTKKERKLTIHPELKEVLMRHYEKRKPELNDFMFPNKSGDPISIQYFNASFKKALKKYGVKGQYSSHALRKTFARRIWAQNQYSQKSLLLLSDALSHSSLKMTKIYLGIRDSEISDLYLTL